MFSPTRAIATAFILALLAAGTSGAALAQSNGCKGHQQDNCEEPDGRMRPGRTYDEGGDRPNAGNFDEDQYKPRKSGQQAANPNWKYDGNKHERRRHKDDKFRFSFGGYWYPQPYWLYDGYGDYDGGYGIYDDYDDYDRVSCREGASILRERGFYRVRPIDCEGRTFTYLVRRHGDSFRVLVSSRTGRIVSVRPI